MKEICVAINNNKLFNQQLLLLTSLYAHLHWLMEWIQEQKIRLPSSILNIYLKTFSINLFKFWWKLELNFWCSNLLKFFNQMVLDCIHHYVQVYFTNEWLICNLSNATVKWIECEWKRARVNQKLTDELVCIIRLASVQCIWMFGYNT